MHGEIDIPLARALLLVGESRVSHQLSVDHFFLPEWERPKRLREHFDLRYANRHLARSRAKQRPLDAEDVTEIGMLREPEDVVAEHVALEVELYAAGGIGEMSKCCLSGRSPTHQAAGETHCLPVAFRAFGIERERFRRLVRSIESIGKRRRSIRDQRVELFSPRFLNEVEIVGHAAALPPAFL